MTKEEAQKYVTEKLAEINLELAECRAIAGAHGFTFLDVVEHEVGEVREMDDWDDSNWQSSQC